MAIPQVVIVGRPNVGKSSLFNWLAGRRIAIVDPTPGVTRDRLTVPVHHDNRYFELVDTGGIGIADTDNLTGHIEKQIEIALAQARVILFVVDARSGLAPLDEEVAGRLRGLAGRVLCVANKCDASHMDTQALEFHRLGLGDPIAVSAKQNRGKQQLLDAVAALIPAGEPGPEADPVLKLAIVGRRNAGKSTFINALARAERVIVSEVPGTTRDSIDVRFELDGKAILAIDTAGVRKKKSVHSDVEFYSLARAERSIRRADVVLLFHDSRASVSQVDKQLSHYVLEQYKPAIFVVNKWDLLKKSLTTEEFADYLRKVFPSLDFVPIAFITARDGKNTQGVVNLAQNLHKQASARVSTGDLNRVLRKALEEQPPPLRQNRRPKIYYATQVAANPPTIVLFTNGPQLFDVTYQRYLLKAFRDHLPFREIPIKMYLRPRRGDDGPASRVEESPPQRRRTPRKKTREEPKLWQD